jgi:hypothetical protein
MNRADNPFGPDAQQILPEMNSSLPRSTPLALVQSEPHVFHGVYLSVPQLKKRKAASDSTTIGLFVQDLQFIFLRGTI